ncbi:hypothetical protein OROHE_015462 [Orobanche hederae]
MSWRGSVSRSLMSTARASAFRSSTPLSAPRRLRSRSVPSSRLNSRLFSFSNPSDIRSTRMRSITYAGDGIKSYVLLGMRYASFL